MSARSPGKLFIAVPLPFLTIHEGAATFCLREWSVIMLVVTCLAIGWLFGRRRKDED